MSDGDGSIDSTIDSFDIFLTGLSLVLYAVDIILDVVLLYNYYASGDFAWFALTMAVLLVSSLFINAINFWLHKRSSSRSQWIVYSCLVLQVLPALGYVTFSLVPYTYVFIR